MIIRTTIAELEKEAEIRYQRWLASAPEPKVINVDATLGFTASRPRSFVYGGVGYRAPPLSYRLGIRLLVAANALRDLRLAEAPAEFCEVQTLSARRVLMGAFRPNNPLRRLTPWKRAFAKLPMEEVESLLRRVLYVPDEAPIVASKERVTVDLIDGLVGFVQRFPFWVEVRRFWWPASRAPLPVSWAAYVYGSRHVSRERARDGLRMEGAVRAAQADNTVAYKAWLTKMKDFAGWSNG